MRQRPRDPEANVVVMRIRTGLGAYGRPQRRRGREPITAAHRPRCAAYLRTRGAVGAGVMIVVGEAVGGPFPDIADQVGEAEGVGLERATGAVKG